MNKKYEVRYWTENPTEYEVITEIPSFEEAELKQNDLLEEGYTTSIEEIRI